MTQTPVKNYKPTPCKNLHVHHLKATTASTRYPRYLVEGISPELKYKEHANKSI